MKFSLSLLLFLLPLLSSAQAVEFTASSDARQVVLDGYFDVSYTLKNATGSDFNPPEFKDFDLLSGPSQSFSSSSVNGKWSREITYSYTLQPKKIGKFTIPSATVKATGKKMKSNTLTVEVVKGKNKKASTSEDLAGEIGEQVFIKAVASTTNAKIGEQILLDYKVYTSRAIESYNLLAESDYPGFFSQDIRRYNGQVIKEVIDGVQYSTKILKRVALFPQQAGRLSIDPLLMELAIAVDDGSKTRRRRSIFDRLLVTRFNAETDTISINVRPLPEDPPATFTGAVGKFEMRSSISRSELTTDDAISIRMTIAGNGDMKQVQAPPLLLGDNFEVYEPKTKEENSFESNGILTGTKEIEYLLLPKKTGRFSIAPGFTYYDTDSLKYITLSSSFSVQVSQGTNQPSTIAEDLGGKETAQELRFIHTDTSFKNGKASFVDSGFFWVLFALPFLLLGGVVVYRQVLAAKGPLDLELLRRQRAQKVAQEKLSHAKGLLDQQKSRAFYDEVSKAMIAYVGDKLNIPLSEMSKDNVRQRLQTLAVSEATTERFIEVLKTCEMALFAGMDNADAMQKTYTSAFEVVAQVAEELVPAKK